MKIDLPEDHLLRAMMTVSRTAINAGFPAVAPTQISGHGLRRNGSLRVANRPPSTEETPRDFPAVPLRELYPTSDIRFVLIEIGKLTTSVERLITDVRSQGEKIDDVRHQVSFVKGAWWVLAALLAGIIWMVATKWHTLVAVFQVINK